MVAQWFPNEEIIVSGDTAYGGQSILSHLPPNVHLISHVHPNGALYEPVASQERKTQRTGPQERGPVARHEAMGRRSGLTVDETRV